MSIKLLELEPQRRDAILNAALKEFASRGFDHASTNVIAKEAGLSKALMFHYVNNKQDLFWAVYDYFTELLDKEYYVQMDFAEKDIFDRLRKSYLLQIELTKQYPRIFDLNKLFVTTNSDEVNIELEKRANKKHSSCYPHIFEEIDESKFRSELDIEKCKQLILWSNIGFTNEILEDMRNLEYDAVNYEYIVKELDGYFEELRKIYYKPGEEGK